MKQFFSLFMLFISINTFSQINDSNAPYCYEKVYTNNESGYEHYLNFCFLSPVHSIIPRYRTTKFPQVPKDLSFLAIDSYGQKISPRSLPIGNFVRYELVACQEGYYGSKVCKYVPKYPKSKPALFVNFNTPYFCDMLTREQCIYFNYNNLDYLDKN